MDDILKSLNDEQLKPVTDTEGAVLVIAGAGSGKTRVLTSRIAYIIKEKQVTSDRIRAITFTNKAANEMKERLSEMVDGVESMWVSTIHSMCTRILRTNAAFLGYEKNFTIYSEQDKDRVLKRISLSYSTDDEKFLKNAKWHISNAKTLGLSPKQYLDEASSQGAKDINRYCAFYAEYETELKNSNALDFDDLLLKTRDLLQSNSDVRSYYANKFRYVHVDEFQDTNTIQYEIIKMLSSGYGNIFAVGDDDQSIYGWRGAEIKNILNFEKDFAGAKVYKLERNYRSTKRILRLANLIIKNNTIRKQKELWTENDEGVRVEFYTAGDEANEAMYTAVQIKNLMARGYSAGDFAVLMRINALSRSYEQEFMKYGIPYKVFGGFKFFERKEIKDLIAYFRILVNPLDNDAILRVINIPKRGIGERTINILLDYAKSHGVCLYDSILDVEELELSNAVKNKIREFRQLIVSLTVAMETTPFEKLLKVVIDKTGYLTLFEADSEENFSKKANIDELQNSIEEFVKLNPKAGVSEYLSSVTLSSDIDEMDDGEFVSIATVHSVKGLEFKCVFICGLEENVFPISRAANSQTEMEEERRLMYVAITRARERLFLTCSQSRYLFGDRQYPVKSRFLGELAPELGINFNTKKQTENAYGSRSDYGGSTSFRGNSDYPKNNYGGNSQGKNTDEIALHSTPSSFGYSSSGAKRFLESSKPKAQVSADKFAGYVVGKRVRHAKFGEGIIVAVKGAGMSKIVDVAFKGIGVKSLSAQYAPMEIIK